MLTLSPPPEVSEYLDRGFAAHQAGRYVEAGEHYSWAVSAAEVTAGLADDDGDAVANAEFGEAEAFRGQAAAKGQIGYREQVAEGILLANLAHGLHQKLDLQYPHSEARRSIGADEIILGRLLLQGEIDDELRTGWRTEAKSGRTLQTGLETVAVARPLDPDTLKPRAIPEPDQLRVNGLWLRALSNVLYGDRQAGIAQAHEAKRMGGESEARLRAVARPLGVLLVDKVIGPYPDLLPTSFRRRAALHLAEAFILGPAQAARVSWRRTREVWHARQVRARAGR